MTVLDAASAGGGRRGVVVVDATSPLEASRRFRRLDVRARARMNCDDWLGSTLLLEDEQDTLVYWWTRSHLEKKDELAAGSYSVNAAADVLCEWHVGSQGTPVPERVPRHVQMRFAAKASERAWARDAAQRRAIGHHRASSKHSLRAGREELDMGKAKGVSYTERRVLADARTNRVRLLDSGAVRRRGPLSLGAMLAAEPCPCGAGAQSRFHVLFACSLPCVVAKREALLTALEAVPEEEKGHSQLRATRAALRGGGAGAARGRRERNEMPAVCPRPGREGGAQA